MTNLLDYILSDDLTVGTVMSQSLFNKIPKYESILDVPANVNDFIVITYLTDRLLWYKTNGHITIRMRVIDYITHEITEDVGF